MLILATAIVLGFLIYLGRYPHESRRLLQMDQPVYFAGGRWPCRGAIRAFHEAGLWNHFQEVAFDLSNVISTHTLFGTLLEEIFGYQETPTVSEVAVYFIYLIPALALYVSPPGKNHRIPGSVVGHRGLQ